MPEKRADETVEVLANGDKVSASNPLPVTGTTTAANTTGTVTQSDDVTVDGTAGGVTLLAANTARKSAMVQNVGSANIRVTYDGSAPTATHGIQLTPGATLRLSQPNVSQSAVKAIREGSTSSSASRSETV